MCVTQYVMDEPTLIGANIYLEGLSIKHVSERYAQWLNDKEVCRENRHGIRHNTIEMTRDYVESVDRADTIAAFAIIRKSDNRHVGNISLGNIAWKDASGEISVLIGEREAWGKGIATEAYKLIISYGFDTLGLRRLYSGMTVRNKGMIRVAEKSGMFKEATLKKAFLKDGIYADIVRYAVTNNDNNAKGCAKK